MFGYKDKDLLNNYYTILIPDNKLSIHNAFTKELDNDLVYNDKIMGSDRIVHGKHKSGSNILLKIRLNTIFFNKKKHIMITLKNKEDKKSLLQEINIYKNIFDHNLDLICIASIDGYFVEVNDAFTNTLGYSKKELYDQSFLNYIYPADLDATLLQLKKLSKGDKVIKFKNRYYTKEKKLKWLSWSAIPKSEFLIYAIARDVTEEENKLRIVIDVENSMNSMEILANIGSWKWYINSDKLEWSDGTKKIFETNNVSFENYSNIIHPDDKERVMNCVQNCISTKLNYEIYHKIKVNNKIKYIYGKGKYTEDTITGDYLIGIVQDITEQVQAKKIELSYKNLGLYNIYDISLD